MAGGGEKPLEVEEPAITVTTNPRVPATSGPAPVTPVALQMGSSSQPAVVAHRSSTQAQTGPGCHPDFADAEAQRESSGTCIRKHASTGKGLRRRDHGDSSSRNPFFAALDRSEEGFCDTCKEAFHVDPSIRESSRVCFQYGTRREYNVTRRYKLRRYTRHTECPSP